MKFLCLYFDGFFKKKSVPLVLSLGTIGKSLPPLSSFPTFICIARKGPLEFPFVQAELSQLSQSFFRQQMLQSYNNLCGPFLDLLQ